VDVVPRARFRALSYGLLSFFGAVFFAVVLLLLRAHGVRWRVNGTASGFHKKAILQMMRNFARSMPMGGGCDERPLGSPQGEVRGLLKRYILKFPVVLLEVLLRKVDPRLLTFPFHFKTGTDLFTPYQF